MPTDPNPPGEATEPDGLVVAAAEELYGASPADFVARRSHLARQARQDGAREAAQEIGALRKPSVAAWSLNHLLRVAPEVVEELTGVGEALRAAQTRLAADELKALRGRRDAGVQAVVTAARDRAAEAGQRLSPTVLEEVRHSAVAALADPAAAQALTSGSLTRSLSYSGFGEVDLADAVARTGTGVPLAVLRGGRQGGGTPSAVRDRDGAGGRDEEAGEREAAQRRAADRRAGERRRAELELARAEREHAAAEAALDAARTASEAAREALAEARRVLVQAQEQDEARLVAVSEAVTARRAAQQTLEAARKALAELPGD